MSFTHTETQRTTETSRRAGSEQLPTVTTQWTTNTTTGPAPASSSAGGGPPGPPGPPPGPPDPSPSYHDQDPLDNPLGGNPGNPGGAPPNPNPNPDPGNADGNGDGDPNHRPDLRDNLADAISALADSIAQPHTQHSKIQEPVQFDGSDSQKLWSFLVQCQLNFNDRVTAFAADKSKVNYVLSFLKGTALDWFEPALLRIQEGGFAPIWFNNYPAFVSELCTNFGPHDPISDAEADIESLRMCDTQCITKYVVEFNQLSSQLEWNNVSLCHQFYKGLPSRIKDNISWVGKPKTFVGMKTLSQSINAQYWERQSEVSCESLSRQKSEASSSKSNSDKKKTSLSCSSSSKPSTLSSSSKFNPKPKPAQPSSSNLSNKLGKDGKITDRERQRQLDNNLCLYCSGSVLRWNFSRDHSHGRITHDLSPDHTLKTLFRVMNFIVLRKFYLKRCQGFTSAQSAASPVVSFIRNLYHPYSNITFFS